MTSVEAGLWSGLVPAASMLAVVIIATRTGFVVVASGAAVFVVVWCYLTAETGFWAGV